MSAYLLEYSLTDRGLAQALEVSPRSVTPYQIRLPESYRMGVCIFNPVYYCTAICPRALIPVLARIHHCIRRVLERGLRALVPDCLLRRLSLLHPIIDSIQQPHNHARPKPLLLGRGKGVVVIRHHSMHHQAHAFRREWLTKLPWLPAPDQNPMFACVPVLFSNGSYATASKKSCIVKFPFCNCSNFSFGSVKIGVIWLSFLQAGFELMKIPEKRSASRRMQKERRSNSFGRERDGFWVLRERVLFSVLGIDGEEEGRFKMRYFGGTFCSCHLLIAIFLKKL